jgi:CRISPR-associated exonuclease Cas4
VELKSGSISDDEIMPHQGDLIQLAAYFLIIEDVYGIRPKEGRLVYKNKMFIIKNTKKIRRLVEDTIDEMRQMLETGQAECEPSFVKCRYCLCRGTVCEYTND